MSATPPPAAPPSARPSTPALEALAAEYRALRAVPRSAAVDERKRELLDELGKRLGDGKHSRADVLRLMGPPDTGEKGSGVIFGLLRGEPRPPQGNELLIYYWRGGHDFLYFDCDGPTVFGASWWAAGD